MVGMEEMLNKTVFEDLASVRLVLPAKKGT